MKVNNIAINSKFFHRKSYCSLSQSLIRLFFDALTSCYSNDWSSTGSHLPSLKYPRTFSFHSNSANSMTFALAGLTAQPSHFLTSTPKEKQSKK
jgi:hypothetical protein